MRTKPGHRTCHDLAPVGDSAENVTADEIRVVGLVVSAVHGVTFEDAVLEAGRKTFDLLLYCFGHIDRGTFWDMTVGPKGVLALGSASGIT